MVEDDFLQFLVNEGLIGDGTLPAGAQGRERARELAAALAPDVLAAARERFARQSTNTGATVASDPLLHRVIGGCRIEKLLGAGGMGAVYQATQLSIDRPVAFKVQKGAPHPELVERFRSEARLLGKLHSPHIVDVYDVGAADGLQYFVMEFMPGGSLTSYVKKQPDQLLSAADTRRMLIECCLGLAEAAEHGVLHRDIKPDNLLLDGRGTVKIADFGIAKLLDAEYGLTQTGFSPGTPAFKSPEQVAASELDFRTDMYSLGVSFWMLLTGVRPRDSLTRQEQLEQMREPLPFSAPEISAANGDPLRLTICRMMALKRADRFATWQELIDTLRALPEGGAVTSDLAPTVLSRTVAPTTKRGNGAMVVAALTVVGAVAFFAWPRHEPPKNDGQLATNGDPARASEVAATPPVPSPRPAEQKTSPPSKEPPATAPSKTPDVDPAPKPQPETSKPAVDTEAPRRAFFAELAVALPTSPRSAAEVDAHLGRLRARAAELRVTNETVWTEVEQALTKEKTAATARDAIRAAKALATFEQHGELVAAAQKIDVPAYRSDAEAFVQTLFGERPAFLRVLPADVASLRSWADWKLDTANVSTNAARPLPLVVHDRRRDCDMVLLGAVGPSPSYLDATEVSTAQWDAKGKQVMALQWPESRLPVRDVAAADVDAFLALHGARLPTVAEFREALGTRAGDRYWWGNEAPPKGLVINVADEARKRETPAAQYVPNVDDGVATLAEVGDPRFAQGANGAFRHLLGNVAESCMEDGKRVVIGGSFLSSTWDAFLAEQRMPVLNPKRQDIGFRAARDIGR